jgi:reactive intermediate/imine deaminase
VTVESTVTFINPDSMPPASGYTHVVEVKNCRMLFISGQVPLDRDGALIGQGDLAAQTDQVFKNIKGALEAAGAGFAEVVKLTLYMTDIAQIQVVREVRDRFVNKQNPPASSAVEVSRLVSEHFLIEVDAVAAIPV